MLVFQIVDRRNYSPLQKVKLQQLSQFGGNIFNYFQKGEFPFVKQGEGI
jgi:hypothetical protein